MDAALATSRKETILHPSKDKPFALPRLPRELRDIIYELILNLDPHLIVRKHLKDKSYPRTPAFDPQHRLVVAGLEFNRGSTALVAMLLASKPTSDEFLEAIHRLVPHHVQCELQDPVYGSKPPRGSALYIREEEAEFASAGANLFIQLTFFGDLSYDMCIDRAVFNDICRLFSRCNQARDPVLSSEFSIKVQDGSAGDGTELETDRTKLMYYHSLPLLEAMPKLLQYLSMVRFTKLTPANFGEYRGRWKLLNTACAMRDFHMSWEDPRVQHFGIQKEGDSCIFGQDNLIDAQQKLLHKLLLVSLDW